MENKNLNFMSVTEACRRLQISRNTAYSLLKTGDLLGFKLGRMWRIPDSSIWQYMRSHNERLGAVYHGNEN